MTIENEVLEICDDYQKLILEAHQERSKLVAKIVAVMDALEQVVDLSLAQVRESEPNPHVALAFAERISEIIDKLRN